MRLIRDLLNWASRRPTAADVKYRRAIKMSDDLLHRIRSDNSNDAARIIVLDILNHRHNGPYMATIFEAVEEVNAPLKQVSQRS